MNSEQMEGNREQPKGTFDCWLAGNNWESCKDSAKARWGRLSDADLDQVGGVAEKLVELIRERYGVSRTEAEAQVRAWEAEGSETPGEYEPYEACGMLSASQTDRPSGERRLGGRDRRARTE